MELTRTIAEMQSTMSSLKDEQKLIESAYAEKQYELRMMQQRGSNLGQGGTKRISSRENLKKTEADIEDLKHRISIDDHPTIFDQIVAAKEAQSKTKNDNQEKDQNSKYGGDESKSKFTEFKDGEVIAEIKEEIKTNEELGKKKDNPADDGATGKEVEAKVGEDKKAITEEHQRKLEVNTDGGRQDFKAKQLSGAKREHGHLSRTEGARWRNIVKNKLMESNGIFENHGEVKDETVERDSDEKRYINNQREAESQAKLLKPENHESKDGNNTTVDKTNHQETDNGINNHPEEHEDGAVQQNWSRRRINNASNNAEQTKSNMFHEEEQQELEVSDAQKQEKDATDGEDDDEEDNNDEFFNESQPEFEDENEKEEYKEEIDESEFQHGL
jgi:hypothetical protein